MTESQRISELQREYETLRGVLKVDALAAERTALEDKMGEPGFWDDQEKAQATVIRLKSLKDTVDTFAAVGRKIDDLQVLYELAEAEADESARAEVTRELEAAEKAIKGLQLRTYFTGKHDNLSAFVALQAGAGGIDACDWTEMLMRLLTRYAERRGFQVDVLDLSKEETAGIRGCTLHVKGPGAFGWLRSERGTHRLVRISPFDAQRRRQTAFAAIDVTPEFADDVEIEIKDSDIQIITCTAGGPGGQHVNKTESAVRLTHLPTGIQVSCRVERSQHANRRLAMKMLMNRLQQLELEKREAEAAAGYQSKSSMGFGAADRIRTYTLQPFTLAKDMRTGYEETDVQEVLDGNIDGFVEAYLRWEAQGRPPRATGKDKDD